MNDNVKVMPTDIAFKTKVDVALLLKGMDRKELSERITEKTGLFCDKAYLCKVLNGNRNPKKIKEAICEILGIDEE